MTILAKLNIDYARSDRFDDVKRFSEFLAEDFLVQLPGITSNRAEFLDYIAKPRPFEDPTMHDVNIRILSGVALIHGRGRYTILADGVDREALHADTHQKRDGTWICVAPYAIARAPDPYAGGSWSQGKSASRVNCVSANMPRVPRQAGADSPPLRQEFRPPWKEQPRQSDIAAPLRHEEFDELHRGPSTFIMPNAWDGPSALLFMEAGVKSIVTSSATLAAKPAGLSVMLELAASDESALSRQRVWRRLGVEGLDRYHQDHGSAVRHAAPVPQAHTR
ncbi:DUF4440 domain-containing protein [Mycobacterium sp. URHB0021]